MRRSRWYDFQGHPRSGSRSGDDLSPLVRLFLSNTRLRDTFWFFCCILQWIWTIQLSEGSAGTYLRCGGIYYAVLLEISSPFQHWKNFENRLRFEKVIPKSLVASFFWNTVYITCAMKTCLCSVVKAADHTEVVSWQSCIWFSQGHIWLSCKVFWIWHLVKIAQMNICLPQCSGKPQLTGSHISVVF